MKLFHTSLKHRLIFCLLILLLSIAIFIYTTLYFEVDIYLALPIILITAIVIGLAFVNYVYKPFALLIESMETGLNCLRDDDFSISLTSLDYKEFDASIDTYNELANILRKERMELQQRELLLDTIIQSTPMAIVLTTAKDIIIYNNNVARKLLNHSGRITSLNFQTLVKNLPNELQEATIIKQDGLYYSTINDEKKIYHLDVQEFTRNSEKHYLYIYKDMTSEVTKEELLIWKKVIKLISHELNNSLAPIQSLSNSAKKLIDDAPEQNMLIDILETIDRRAMHLHHFIEKYAKYSRLPLPSYNNIDINKFVDNLEKILDLSIKVNGDFREANFDATQLEQVIINIVKNAKESGGLEKDVEVEFELSAEQLKVIVKDRGTGMTDKQLVKSLLPFYTTKNDGSGLGLALSKEIVNAHNGKLKLYNRVDSGLIVELEIPR